ncbi:MAG: phosphoenolpyruvate--protein phosphotransferase [Desulfobacterales bacterium]|nr:phosphoenolpyruvate--protein phosphotransferase [Desulfobacterales bacterium]
MKKVQTDASEVRLHGISGSSGICIGKAYLVDREGVDVIKKYAINSHKAANEINRFKNAVSKAKNELVDIIKGLPSDLRQNAYILETHLLLLNDKMLHGKTVEIIKNESVNAEWALKEATTQAKSLFSSIEDPYLKGRSADIEHVSNRIMRNLVGFKDVNISGINKRVILVADNLSPAETSQIQLEKIMGFITDHGGKASHTSIIARTLEIPAVLGLGSASHIINNDDIIIVDGMEGLVIIHPEEETLVEYDERIKKYAAHKAEIKRTSDLQAKSTDGKVFKVMGNIELPEEIVTVKDHGGDGIGLFRTEFLYMNRIDFPDEQELFEQYKEVVELMAPKPVTIRTLDINGDKEIYGAPKTKEANPVLGLRAIRFCLKNPDVFKTQLRAILRAAAFGNVRLLLPMISGCEEIQETYRLLDEIANALEKQGLPYRRDIHIGIMVEVPSAAIIADAMAGLVDFFSIGTNDLVQYTLAADRGNRHVDYLYNALHPAVIRLIHHVVVAGNKNHIKTFMCGEMAADIMNLPILIGLGVDELSMSPQSIPAIKNMIRKFSVSECREFAAEVLKKITTEAVMRLIRDTYGNKLINDLKAEKE